jgi:glycosyltransferase involved in cell wall biosynthesis
MELLNKSLRVSKRMLGRLRGKGAQPRSGNEAFQHALALGRQGKHQASLDAARTAQKRWPNDRRLPRPEARALLRLNRPSEAMEVMQRIEGIEPDLEQIDVLRRAIYRANIEVDNFEVGLAWARKAVAIWPDNDEYRRFEIRLLARMGREEEAFARARDFEDDLDEDEEETTAIIYDALRFRMVQAAEAEDWNAAVVLWFKMAELSPDRPRSANVVVDMALSALAAQGSANTPCPELDTMNQLAAATTAGDAVLTRELFGQIIDTVDPLDWLPRYLKIFPRTLDEATGIAVLQTIGVALLSLDTEQIEILFIANPIEAMDLSAALSQHQVSGDDPARTSELANLFLGIDLTKDGRPLWEQMLSRINSSNPRSQQLIERAEGMIAREKDRLERRDIKDKTLAARVAERNARAIARAQKMAAREASRQERLAAQSEKYAAREDTRNRKQAVRDCMDLSRIDDHAGALAYASEALKIWPDELRLMRTQARALLKLERLPEAMEIMDQLEKTEPNLGEIEPLRRAIYRAQIAQTYQSGDLEASLTAAQAALSIWPDAAEYRRAEIRLLVQLGNDAQAFARAQAFRAMNVQSEERTQSLVQNAIRNRQTWLGERGDFEGAIAAWFSQSRFYDDQPRTPNSFVDNCLSALAARGQNGPTATVLPELDLMEQIADASAAGDTAQTKTTLIALLETVTPNDWLPRYLRLYTRNLDSDAAARAIQTLGNTLLDLSPAQAQHLFGLNTVEATSFVTMFSRGQITATDPDLVLRLADMFLDALGPSTQGYSARANVHFQLENFEQSRDDINRALALDPYAMGALQTEFNLLATSGRHADAAARLDTLQACGEIDAISLATLASKGQMTTRARTLFTDAIAADPANKPLVSAYIKFCYHNGYWGHCLTAFERDGNLRSGHRAIATDVYDLLEQAGLDAADVTRTPDRLTASTTAFGLATQQMPAPYTVSKKAKKPGKRAAIVIGSLGPGGAERQCSVLVRTIARDPEAYGISELKLLCTNLTQSPKSSFLLDTVREVGIEPVEYFSRDRQSDLDPPALRHMLPRSRAQVMVQLREALQEFQPDVIHGILNETIVNAGLAARHMSNVRLVGRWGSLPPGFNRQVSERADDNNLYLQSAYRDLIATHPNTALYSNATEATHAYEDWLGQPRGTFTTIYNGIEADQFNFDVAARTDIRRELGIDEDAVVVGTAFRFTEEKRPFVWLDVAKAVAAQSKAKMAFIMLGNGPLLLSAQQYAAEQGITNVHFVGRQSDIGRWWSATDIGLMTSSVEGISNTVIEAQLLGRPMVAFNVGGMPEAISDGVTGKLFENGSQNDMVNFITALSENSRMLSDMGEASTKFAINQFSAETLAKNTTDLY